MRSRLRHTVERGLCVRESNEGRAGEGARVLWIHGLGESGVCFERLVDDPRLAGATHLVPDLPGYGRSAPLGEAEGLESSADRLATLLEERGWTEAIVAGHSMGGVIGVLLSERCPERVRGFLNVEGNLSRGDCVFSSQAVDAPLGSFVDSGFDAMRERIFEAGREDLPLRGYYASLRLADAAQFHRHAEELVAISSTESLATRHASLGCPTLYVAGVPRGICARSLDMIGATGTPMVRIDRAGHWPFLDQPEEFVARAEGFFGTAGATFGSRGERR